MPWSRWGKNGDKNVDNDGSKMIKCVDEDSNDKADNAMVSHNKEEEEGEGGAGMPNWLKRCQQQISAHKIYERPIPCAPNVSILDN